MGRRLLCLFLLAASPSAFSQRFPDRWLTLNPLTSPMSTPGPTVQWMHATGGWGEFGGYRLVRDKDHAWLQRLGGFLELYREGDERSLAFLGHIEFIADADNDIRFNPRAILWEEGFLYTQRWGGSYWQAGYFHRCKHDVDNLVVGKERSLIFGGLLFRYLSPFPFNGETSAGLLTVRADLYTIRQDARIPSTLNAVGLSVKRLMMTLGGSVYARAPLTSILGVYGSGWGGVNVYGRNESIFVRVDAMDRALFAGGVAGGVAITGRSYLRIGFQFEYQPDTGIDPLPVGASLLSIGIQIIDPVTMW